ncbi:MAG: hypothetical protein HY056_01980 [Proteobacteria bacterium]|nr:hypothetical protein [Pseudomonadota bacterium]
MSKLIAGLAASIIACGLSIAAPATAAPRSERASVADRATDFSSSQRHYRRHGAYRGHGHYRGGHAHYRHYRAYRHGYYYRPYRAHRYGYYRPYYARPYYSPYYYQPYYYQPYYHRPHVGFGLGPYGFYFGASRWGW